MTIRLHGNGNVVVARADIPAGAEVAGEGIVCRAAIPHGHKVATAQIAAGAPVQKFDQIIGVAGEYIRPGGQVIESRVTNGQQPSRYSSTIVFLA